jgi:DNA-binding NtrC family response regulator
MKYTVLVVDDERPILDATSRVLERAGYQVEVAVDGDAALEMLQRKPVDLLLLDLHLGARDGISVLSTMREAGHVIPVLMISGQGSIDLALQAVRLGAFDFLEKPVEPDRLLLSIRNALKPSLSPRATRSSSVSCVPPVSSRAAARRCRSCAGSSPKRAKARAGYSSRVRTAPARS